MFQFFKTTTSFNHPYEYMFTKSHTWLQHPLDSGRYENKICQFGTWVAYIYGIWFLVRHIVRHKKTMKRVNRLLIFLLVFGGFLLNFNAFVYSVPILFIEYCRGLI